MSHRCSKRVKRWSWQKVTPEDRTFLVFWKSCTAKSAKLRENDFGSGPSSSPCILSTLIVAIYKFIPSPKEPGFIETKLNPWKAEETRKYEMLPDLGKARVDNEAAQTKEVWYYCGRKQL